MEGWEAELCEDVEEISLCPAAAPGLALLYKRVPGLGQTRGSSSSALTGPAEVCPGQDALKGPQSPEQSHGMS